MTTNLANSPYKASLGNTSRTYAQRASDIKNVKDFGATGAGTGSDSAAIQAAIDWQTANGNRGIIFFPRGVYILTVPITLNYVGNLSITLRGSAPWSTVLATPAAMGVGGTFTGSALIERTENTTSAGGLTIEHMQLFGNGISLAGVQGGCLRNLSLTGGSLRAYDNIQSLRIENVQATSSGQSGTGLLIGGKAVSMMTVGAHNWNVAMQLFGGPLTLIGGHTENNNTAYVIGKDQNGTVSPLLGGHFSGFAMEANQIAWDVYGATACEIAGLMCQGTTGAPTPPSSSNGIIIRNNALQYCNFNSVYPAGGFQNYTYDIGSGQIGTVFENCGGTNGVALSGSTSSGTGVLTVPYIPAGVQTGQYVTGLDAFFASRPIVLSLSPPSTILCNQVATSNIGAGVSIGFTDLDGNDIVQWKVPSPSGCTFRQCTFNPKTTKTSSVTLDATYHTQIELNSGSAISLSIRHDSYFSAPYGETYRVVQLGAGTASIIGDNTSGTVGVHFISGANTSAGQYGVLYARKRAANDWIVWRGS